MISSSVHFPALYNADFDDPMVSSLYAQSVFRLLMDVIQNGVLLEDENGEMRREIVGHIEGWPVSHRKAGMSALVQLGKRNRLVAVAAPHGATLTCGSRGCEEAADAADAEHPGAIIGRPSCEFCASHTFSGVLSAPVHEYLSLPAIRQKLISRPITIPAGSWTADRFSNEILRPLFRYAHRLKLVDRYIGRSVIGRDSVAFKPSYRRSLDWIVGEFAAASLGGAGQREVEITCGLQESSGDTQRAANLLRAYAAELSARLGLRVVMTVKLERPHSELPHGRFLITDQFAVLIERGFDLIGPDGKVRDVVVVLLGSAGQVEAEARLLRDA